MSTYRRIGMALIALGLAAGGMGLVEAQDGGPDREALVLRVLAARAGLDISSSYVETETGATSQQVAITMRGQSQPAGIRAQWQRAASLIRQETGPNIQAQVNTSIEQTGLGPGDAVAYSTTTELRLVEGVLYVKTAYTGQARPDLPALPRSWVIVADPDISAVYGELQRGDLLNPVALAQDGDLLRSATVTIEDGETQDVITFTLDRDGTAAALRDSPAAGLDPGVGALLYETLEPDTSLWLAATLGPTDALIALEVVLTARAAGIDAHALAPEHYPDDVWIDIVIDVVRRVDYSQVNAPLVPAEVPRGVSEPATIS